MNTKRKVETKDDQVPFKRAKCTLHFTTPDEFKNIERELTEAHHCKCILDVIRKGIDWDFFSKEELEEGEIKRESPEQTLFTIMHCDHNVGFLLTEQPYTATKIPL
jgi:hypothetical protein